MNKSRSLGSDALQLTMSKMVVLLISMVTGMLLSRFRSFEEYGTYSQIIMVITLATTIVMMGLPNSLNYFLAKADTDEERRHFLSVYYTASTVLSLLVGVILVCITPLLTAYFKNPLIKNFIYFLAIFPWTKIICSSVENVLVVYRKTGFIAVYRIANSISLLGIIVLVQLMNWSFSVYMLLYLLVEAVFALWVYLIAYRNAGSIGVSFDFRLIKTILTFSIPLGLASMVGTLNVELDKFVIGGMMGTEKLAIYTNASREMPVTIIATSITAVLMPQMVRMLKNGKKTDAVKLWGSATTLSFAAICFFAVALFVFAPEVMTLLYSEKYLPGTSVFRIYSMTLMLRCTYFGMLLNVTGKTKFILYSSIGSLVLNISLNYILYYLLGFIGPALATFLSSFIMSFFQLVYSAKVCEIKFKTIFPWKNIFLLLLLISVTGGIVLLSHKFISQYINSLLSAILIGLLWFVLLSLILYKPLLKQWRILNV